MARRQVRVRIDDRGRLHGVGSWRDRAQIAMQYRYPWGPPVIGGVLIFLLYFGTRGVAVAALWGLGVVIVTCAIVVPVMIRRRRAAVAMVTAAEAARNDGTPGFQSPTR